MGPKTRKHKSDHRKSLQKAGQHSNSDADDSVKPANQSSNAEAFLPANSTDKLKDQPDDQKKLLDVVHSLPEAGRTISHLQPDLSLSGSASKTDTDEPGATGCQSQELNGKEDEFCSDASFEAAAAVVRGGYSASDRLMQQIDSLLRDSEFTAPYKPKLAFEEFAVKHTDDSVPAPNFKLETGSDTPEMSVTDAGNVTQSNTVAEPYNGASHKVCQSQDAEKLSEIEPLSNLVKADLFLADNENLGDFLNLLHHLKGK